MIYSVRKKLKKQYIHLEGKKIEKLKKSGVQVHKLLHNLCDRVVTEIISCLMKIIIC